MPIIELQKMATIPTIGKIRLGYSEAREGGGKTPKKSDKWILTSPRRELIEAAAAIYGGTVEEWEGQYRLFTKQSEIRVYVTPIEASQWLEHWDGGECLRRCDSETCHVPNPHGGRRISKPCICEADGRRICKTTSRYSFMIPELPEIGIWRYESRGFYSAIEIPKMLDFVRVAGQLVVEAWLGIEIRKAKVRGQIAKFPVAVVRVKKRPEAALGSGRTVAALGEQAKALLAGNMPATVSDEETPVQAILVGEDEGDGALGMDR